MFARRHFLAVYVQEKHEDAEDFGFFAVGQRYYHRHQLDY